MLSYALGTTRFWNRALMLVALVMGIGVRAQAQIPLQYTFSYRTTAATDMTGATLLRGDSTVNDDVVTGVQPIGFPFVFQGTVYTNYSASSNGLLKLGNQVLTGQFGNALKANNGGYPIIANFWEDLFLDLDPVGANGGAAGVRSKLTGAPGNRVLTVEWKARRFGFSSGPGEVPYYFQTRLYERTNVIELYYGSMSTVYSTSGSIGIALDTGRFISVTPGWGAPLSAPTTSTTVANDTIQLAELFGGEGSQGETSVQSIPVERLPSGMTYVFTPIVMPTFTSNGSPVSSESPLFSLTTSCLGDAAVSIPITVTNPGLFDVNVNAFDLFQVDSTDVQGAMNLQRDAQGRVVRTTDYVISDAPGTAPVQTNVPATFPDTIAAGSSRTYYLTFVGQRAGRRLARAFVRTNGTTFSGADTNAAAPTLTSGLLVVDLVAEGVGSRLARNLNGDRPGTLVFPDTRAGDTTIRTLTIVNSGACDLRIKRGRMRIFSGDVNEYKILSAFSEANFDAVNDDWVISPSDSGTITVAFMPVRSGTRMATIFMQTNDSALGIPGITERGSFYLDLHGRGRAGLDARELVLRPVVVGTFTNGAVEVENTSIATVDIARIWFEGLDSAEFTEDASAAWPTLPARIVPGRVLRLGVRLTPAAAATARVHRTTMVIVTTTGDTLRIRIRGEVGTQQLVVSPSSLFDNVSIPVGATARQTIRISNTGTLPVRLTAIALTGVDSVNYRLGILPRRELDPGQTEFLEVTFAPLAAGQALAQVEISSNAGPIQIVTLGGTANRIRRAADDTRISGHKSEDAAVEREGRSLPSLR